ncbi:MAG: ribonuclease Y [Candidatus Lloydbacteria bacterium CG22_combo_CG10-13_8_21_14_all_47_15]|uniref:Ribonuclease Y n=1 Tax=Candidatus Lloydbacteria bacterium CG22_combo_CG10-13_8_21_14_all_47_15 TaxID=1974635 RepID=A0A2H0CUG9_9BACT|nr:MAG: ribonuclease Y [Candidatus Lloydbacteria bacterium CG22_combo_CG10-13_8_21_14_all_47_15]
MDIKTVLMLTAATGIGGIVFGYFFRWLVSLGKKSSTELKLKQMLLAAKEDAQKITEEADKKAARMIDEARQDTKEKELQMKTLQERLLKKEELLDKRQTELAVSENVLKKKADEITKFHESVEMEDKRIRQKLEEVAGLSSDEAREQMIKEIEKAHEEDLSLHLRKLEAYGNEELDRKAKEIISSAIHRYGNAVPSDVMTSTVALPSDELKGKIIGKEGRNIRAFERAAGVDVIIDDTPGAITISAFDPVRRQIARIALENLIIDGRIQPAKIEEAVEKARTEINKIIKEKGEQAAYECGVYNLDPRVVSILGRLYFRTSYGQNVLQHSIEMAHIAGMLAEEVGADVAVAKAGALLHDLGKAVDHEIQGTHVEIGRRILQKFGADKRIIQAMQAHHEEYPYETPESILVQVADAISGGRPGARRDTVEQYLKRLSDLETIADSFDGVLKSFAIQAGREVRVLVNADKTTDFEAQKLAREIARKIEQDLKYPGEIKVNVIRELRAVEFAR